jgi:integrase
LPHHPKPFFRADRGLWYVQVQGKQHNLGRDKAEAFRRYHALMAAPPLPVIDAELLVSVIDAYLDWCQKNRGAKTYAWQKDHVESFCNSLPDPQSFRVADLKPLHVVRWADSHPRWGNSQKRGAMGAVQRAFNWAEKLGVIDHSPIRRIADKPAQGHRDDYLTPEQFRGLIEHYAAGDSFRDLLEFCWESGARPQESKLLEARHFDRAGRRFVIPADEAKGKKRVRVIHLTDAAFALAEKWVDRHPTGPLFRNRSGRAWKTYAINCRFVRLKKKTGVKFCQYLLRHSYCQRLLEAGLDATVVAGLMGHANAAMVQKVYSHMGKAQNFLAAQLKKVAG